MYKCKIVMKNKKEWIEYYTKILSHAEKPYSEDVIKTVVTFPFEFVFIPV